MTKKKMGRDYNELDDQEKKLAQMIMMIAVETLAISIFSGAKPGMICSVGLLLIEYALVQSNYDKAEALQIIEESSEHLRAAVERGEGAISLEQVTRRIQTIANEAQEEDGEYKH